jgi:hypothetical protein
VRGVERIFEMNWFQKGSFQEKQIVLEFGPCQILQPAIECD